MASGAILATVACYEPTVPQGKKLHVHQLLCPFCPVWPTPRERVRAGGLIFPSLQGSTLMRNCRVFGARLGRPGAGSLGAHSFRRGAARTLSVEAWGTFAQIFRAG